MLLAVAVIVVVLIARACSGGTTPNPSATPPPSATPSATPTPTPSTLRTTTCQKQDLQVTAATDAVSYPSGVLPRLSAVVRNTSGQVCRFRTAPAQRVWTIVSGPDRIWTSTDCTTSTSVATSRLRPGHTIAYALVWNRHRSAKGCPAQTSAAAPGTYQLRVSVNGVAAGTVVFHLTA